MDKRRYPRFELKVDAKYNILSSEETLKGGMTRNMSAEGICFESEERITPGSHVNLEVNLGDKMEPVSLLGEVRWSQELVKQKKFINGVKLIEVPKTDEARFLKYYCDRMVEKLSGYLKM